MKTHLLKCWPEPFAAAAAGVKRHEFRRADRDFEVGDCLLLKEWDPAKAERTARLREEHPHPDPVADLVPAPHVAGFTGQSFTCIVLYLQRGPDFGIPEGFVVLSIVSGEWLRGGLRSER